jgi:hypothetical protein
MNLIRFASLFSFLGMGFLLSGSLAFANGTLGVKSAPTVELTPTVTRITLPLTPDVPCRLVDIQERPLERQSVLQFTARPFSSQVIKTSANHPSRNMHAFYFEMNPNGRLQLFVKHKVPSTLNLKCRGSDMVIEVLERYKAVEYSETITKGLKYVRYSVAPHAGALFRTHHLEWDPYNSSAKLTPLMPEPNSLRGLKTARSTLAQYNALAGVNASFFNANLRIPLGIVLRDGEVLNGTLFNRVAFGLDMQNRASMDQVELTGLIRVGRWSQAIEIVNMPRSHGEQVALYSRLWGTQSPPAGGGNIAVRLRNGRFDAITQAGTLAIEGANDWVIYGSASRLDKFLSADLGTSVEVMLSTLPDWSDKSMVLAGGPTLLKKGQVSIDLEAQRFGALPPNQRRPRTAIAILPNNKVHLVVVDALPLGATLQDTAEILQVFGAVDAMNLDGGTSTQMVVQGQVKFATIKGGSVVSTVLGFVPTLPWPAI